MSDERRVEFGLACTLGTHGIHEVVSPAHNLRMLHTALAPCIKCLQRLLNLGVPSTTVELKWRNVHLRYIV